MLIDYHRPVHGCLISFHPLEKLKYLYRAKYINFINLTFGCRPCNARCFHPRRPHDNIWSIVCTDREDFFELRIYELYKRSFILIDSLNTTVAFLSGQCWNWPKRTGGGVSCRNVWNFAQGLKFKADFHSKMGVCRHELGVQPPNSPQFQPCVRSNFFVERIINAWNGLLADQRDFSSFPKCESSLQYCVI